jgi:flagellar biosynthesis protein FliP
MMYWICTLLFYFIFIFSLCCVKVYSAAQKAAKAQGKSPEEAWDVAQAARKEYLVSHIV